MCQQSGTGASLTGLPALRVGLEIRSGRAQTRSPQFVSNLSATSWSGAYSPTILKKLAVLIIQGVLTFIPKLMHDPVLVKGHGMGLESKDVCDLLQSFSFSQQ